MIKDLDQIDWKSMDAEIVPDVLRSYIQGKKLETPTIKAYEALIFLDHSQHDLIHNDFYKEFPDRKVITILIPFLIQLARSPEINTAEKANILWDLEFIVGWVDSVDEKHYTEHYKYALELREMVWEGHDIYFELLSSENDREKIPIINLLSRYREYAEIVLPHLLQRLQVETDEWQVRIICAIFDLFLRSGRARESAKLIIQDQLLSFLSKDYQHAVRVASFLTLIDIWKSETPSTVIDVMLEYCMKQSRGWMRLPNYTIFPGESLLKLGSQKGIEVAIKIMEQSLNTGTKFNAVYASLLLAFDPNFAPDGFCIYYPSISSPPSTHYTLSTPSFSYSANADVQNLTAVQKRVLKVLTEQDWLWQYGTSFERKFGLPDKREAMRELI